MFTWECPTCGRELDVSHKECPDCRATESGELKPPEPPDSAQAESAPTPAPRPPARPSPPPAKARTGAAADAFQLAPSHLLLFVFLLGAAVAAAVFLARPDLFTGVRLPLGQAEPGPDVQPGRGSSDPLEVAGVRVIGDEQEGRRVRVVVVNHSQLAQRGIVLRVDLLPLGAPEDADPAATFYLNLEEPLEPGEVREVEAPLQAEPDAFPLPPWQELRLDVRRQGSR